MQTAAHNAPAIARRSLPPGLLSALGDPGTLRERVANELERRRCVASLHEYTKAAWDSIEPGTPFVDGWHLGAISEHLQACSTRQIRNLVINMPPRHMKSISVGVAWPTWGWTNDPKSKWLFASYGAHLSIRDAIKSRRVLNSPWYQKHWGAGFAFNSDQNAKSRYENDRSGYRIATSVGGLLIGEGGDFIVVDDPHNQAAAESAVQRQSVLEWWDQALSTRFNDPKTGVRVLVMQRLHQHDLTGHVLQEQGWDHLILPAEYEKSSRVTSIGWSDPRTEDGELLWPERFGPAEIADLKTKLGSYGAAGQLQQRPAPRDGGMIKLAWFKDRYKALPEPTRIRRITQSWDTANKAKQLNDYSVGTTWIETDTHHYLAEVVRAKLEFPELLRTVQSFAAKWAGLGMSPQAILIEDAASGTQIIQQLRADTILPVIAISTRGVEQEVRVSATTPTMEAGRVLLPEEAPWLHDLEQELAGYPAVAHDDQTISVAQYLAWAAAPAEIFIG